jgi:cysteine desulfurase/selenocysteine lyase
MENLREQFPILEREVNGKPLIYFDNAATSQKPTEVIDAISDYYLKTNANVHRGVHTLATESTNAYVEAHRTVGEFINADMEEIFFTRSSTEGLNFIANVMAENVLEDGDVVVISEMEHHSNIVPWQLIDKQVPIKIEWIPILEGTYQLDMEYLEFLVRKYRERIKVISLVHLSNVLGVRNDIEKVVEVAKSVEALTVVDGAQSIIHSKVDVKDMDIDFLVFSGHKMFGPTGIGVVYGRKELLEQYEPWQGGGEMVESVAKARAEWAETPWKFEAGTPNIAGAVGLDAAIKWIDKNYPLGQIKDYERKLMSEAIKGLKNINPVKIFGPEDPNQRDGSLSFTVPGVHPHDIASLLDEKGIAIRAGYHCAEPLHKKFDVGPSARVSFAGYNTIDEVRIFIDALRESVRSFV